VSTLPTEEIGFGLLPTITASFGERGGNLNTESNHDTEKAMRIAIPKLMGMLPTPTLQDARIGPNNIGGSQHRMQRGSIALADVALGLNKLLPTPTAFDATNASAEMKSSQVKEGSMHSVTLTRAMMMGMLPTPNSRDFRHPQEPEKHEARKNLWAEKGVNLQLSLPQAIRNGMLPTPTTHDSKHSTTKSPSWDRRIQQKHLAETVLNPYIQETGGKTSQLNPQFVLEMMGFPPNWTELPFQNGETNQ
jgi:hypothetical protein